MANDIARAIDIHSLDANIHIIDATAFIFEIIQLEKEAQSDQVGDVMWDEAGQRLEKVSTNQNKQ